MDEARRELISVLCEARSYLALPSNEFIYSHWDSAEAALHEIDQHILVLDQGQLPEETALAILFAPTGSIQEVSISSGWAEEFLNFSTRFDQALKRVYR